MILLGTVLLLGFGAFMLAYPEAFWLMEKWKYEGDAQPSKRYIIETRIIGALLVCLGIWGFLVSFGILK